MKGAVTAMNKKGKLIVVSGPSGAGKGTVLRELMNKHDGFVYSVSATTRNPRDEDKEGVTYFFMSKDEFRELIENGGLLEYATYNDNYYGTPRRFVEERIADGKNVILEIEVQGAMQIKKLFPEALLVFITPESFEVLSERLRSRGTETEDVIENRLAIARKEAPTALEYDYIIVNRDGGVSMAADELYECVSTDGYTQSSDNRDVIKTFIL